MKSERGGGARLPEARQERGASGRMVDPKVFIVLVDWYGGRDTVECLESVFNLDYSSYQVVVCCNSDPRTPERLKSAELIEEWVKQGVSVETAGRSPLRITGGQPRREIRTIRLPGSEVLQGEAADAWREADLVLIDSGANLGFAGGNNLALKYIDRLGEAAYVWLLNNDTVVDSHSLRALVELGESRPDAGILGSKLLEYDTPEVIQAAAGGSVVRWSGLTRLCGSGERDSGQWDEVSSVDYVTGASLLIRMAVVHEIGLLDERYFLYSEEVDWCLRATDRGWRLLYAPGSKVWHKGGQSVGYGSEVHDYYTVRSMLLLVQKFSPASLPLTFLYSFYRCLAPKVLRRQPARLRAVLRAYKDFGSMLLTGRFNSGQDPAELRSAAVPNPLS